MSIFHKHLKTFLFALFLLFPFIFSQSKIKNFEFILVGTIDNVDNGYIKLWYIDHTNQPHEDSCQIDSNGHFLFKGKIKDVTLSRLTYVANTNFSFSDDIILFLERNLMKIKISHKFKLKSSQGSETQNEWIKLNESKIYKSVDSLMNIKDTISKEMGYEKQKNLVSALQKQKIYDYEFAKNHSLSYLSPYLLSFYLERRKIGLDSIEKVLNKFTYKVKKSSFGLELKEKIKLIKSSSVGKTAFDFVKNDISGTPIQLSYFRNRKYILLYFSASWCKPCLKQIPKLKDLYKKYHPKDIEIIVISWDLDEQSWKKGVETEDIKDWYNVFDSFNSKSGGLRPMYSISSIPSFVLIDKKGIIIGRYDNMGLNAAVDDLEKKLINIFGN